jgi:hypothetical protein
VLAWRQDSWRIRGNRRHHASFLQLQGFAHGWPPLTELWRSALAATFLCDRYQPRLSTFEVVHVSAWEWSNWHVVLSAHSNAQNVRFDEFSAVIGLPTYDETYPDREIAPAVAKRLKVELLGPFRTGLESVVMSGACPGLADFKIAEFWDTDSCLVHSVKLAHPDAGGSPREG